MISSVGKVLVPRLKNFVNSNDKMKYRSNNMFTPLARDGEIRNSNAPTMSGNNFE